MKTHRSAKTAVFASTAGNACWGYLQPEEQLGISELRNNNYTTTKKSKLPRGSCSHIFLFVNIMLLRRVNSANDAAVLQITFSKIFDI